MIENNKTLNYLFFTVLIFLIFLITENMEKGKLEKKIKKQEKVVDSLNTIIDINYKRYLYVYDNYKKISDSLHIEYVKIEKIDSMTIFNLDSTTWERYYYLLQ